MYKKTYAELVGLRVTAKFDFAMHSPAQFTNNHVFVDHFVAGHGMVLLHHGVGLFDRLR